MIDWLLRPFERWIRRRAAARPHPVDVQLPEALAAFALNEIIPLKGFQFRVRHRRVQPDGSAPALVLEPVAPTRRHLLNRMKTRREELREADRLSRVRS